ncbi:MAG: helix-turn-helix transcriptional regulator [Gammaproteobacteria bacterium]|nr:helix-turn-helix transcriptional regulator [Gammaproteobacteria bacterium]
MPGLMRTRASSINRALDQVGDKWCMLILQEIFWGVNSFNELLSVSGMSRGVLSQRLNWLQQVNCLKKLAPADNSRRPVYRLTRKSNDLYGNALMSLAWERRFFKTSALDSIALRHKSCGNEFSPVMRCRQCAGELNASDVTYTDGPGATSDLRAKKIRRRSSISIMDVPSTNTLYKNLIHIVGDRWTANVIALAFHGLKRFDEFHAELPIATNTLSHRLRFLTDSGIFKPVAYQQKPLRYEYHLSAKGLGLYPFFLSLLQWGDRWCGDGHGVPMIAHHQSCGFDLTANVCCDQCDHVLEAHDVTFDRPEVVAGKSKNIRSKAVVSGSRQASDTVQS